MVFILITQCYFKRAEIKAGNVNPFDRWEVVFTEGKLMKLKVLQVF